MDSCQPDGNVVQVQTMDSHNQTLKQQDSSIGSMKPSSRAPRKAKLIPLPLENLVPPTPAPPEEPASVVTLKMPQSLYPKFCTSPETREWLQYVTTVNFSRPGHTPCA